MRDGILTSDNLHLSQVKNGGGESDQTERFALNCTNILFGTAEKGGVSAIFGAKGRENGQPSGGEAQICEPNAIGPTRISYLHDQAQNLTDAAADLLRHSLAANTELAYPAHDLRALDRFACLRVVFLIMFWAKTILIPKYHILMRTNISSMPIGAPLKSIIIKLPYRIFSKELGVMREGRRSYI